MSNPPNLLEQYSTYSYHHILVACDSTNVAEAIINSGNLIDLVQDIEPNTTSDPFAQYKRKPFVGKIKEKDKDKQVRGAYVPIINGMVDSEFVIQSVDWYQTVAAKSSSSIAYQVLAADGKMVVEEPRGIRFMNVMSVVSDNLKTSPAGLIFILKTIFKGYNSAGFIDNPMFDRKDSVDPILNVKPQLLYIYDITGTFTISGGIYTLNFCGINNGATKTYHIMKANDRISINISKPDDKCQSNTLSGAICRLQNRIREIYIKHYDETIKSIKQYGINFDGRFVKYTIILEDPYTSPEYVVDDFKTQITEKGEKDEGGIIHLGKETCVEGAILAIVNRCSKIQQELSKEESGSEDSGKKIRYLPKVETTIRSSDTEFEVIYKVRRVMESRNSIISQLAKRKSDSVDDLSKDIQANVLELDYIYTGKNVDILDFDINMNMGTAFLQTIATANSIPTNLEAITGTLKQDTTSKGATQIDPMSKGLNEKGDGGQSAKDVIENARIAPIFFSTLITKDLIKHATDAKRSGEFAQLLSRHAAFENIDTKVKIVGNPGLLNSLSQLPSEIIGRTNQSDTVNTPAQFDQNGQPVISYPDIFPHWGSIPSVVKINIKMPTNDEDGDFAQNFWYNGFYYCYAIENNFDAGLFTQTLHMVSVPQEREDENKQEKGTTKSQSDETKASSSTQSTTLPPGQVEQALAEDPDKITVDEYLQAQFRIDAG